jgi:queuosine precursor transporter
MIVIVIFWILGMLSIASVAAIISKRHGVEYLIGMFAGAVVITAVVANKLVVFGPFTLSASIIVFSITFYLTDVISEFWGKKEAQKAVWAGFLADILLLFAIWVAIKWQPASFWPGQEAFTQTLGTTWRVASASLIAYIVAQNHDVWAYHFWKMKFKGKHLWIRNNFSTGVSQIIDSILFASIAFYGVAPVVPIIISTIVVKFIIAILDTPFLYAVRWYFEKVKPYKMGLPADGKTGEN